MEEILGVKIFNVKDTADILNLCEPTVLKYLNNGKIIGQKSGRRWIVTEDNIKNYLHNTTQKKEL